MDRVSDEPPRLSREEADTRAAALIAQYRDQEHGSRGRRSSRSWFSPGLGAVLVYLAGVTSGTVWHAKPLVGVFFGVPVLLIARALMKRQEPK